MALAYPDRAANMGRMRLSTLRFHHARALAVTALVVGSLGQLACADFPADVRRHTYPPNFRYITQDQIQSTMWQLASLVESLEETLSRPHHDDEGRAKITSILAQMEAAVRTLKGEGVMVMETPEGDWAVEEMRPGRVLYVPPRWAHRSVNTSANEDLVFFFVYPGHSGHDYGAIEETGFRKLVVEHDGKPVIIDNPRWHVSRG
jgi:hypothetical protein